MTVGTSISVTGDEFVAAGTGTRYAFRGWNDGNQFKMSRSTSYAITLPVTITAYYWPQHLVAFDQSGIPAATTWHVNVAGSNQVGPTSRWVDEGTSVAFSYESPVAGTAGTRYVLSGTSTSSPVTVASPVTVTGTYNTQYLLTVQTSGLGTNTTSVRNGVSLLGTATDATPLAVFLPLGTVLSLNVDDPVNGAGGTQYFFQTFSPAPPGTLTSAFTTSASYKTMSQQIDIAIAGGGIQQQGGSGVAGALKLQWAAAEADLAAGNFAQALTDIESFVASPGGPVGQEGDGRDLA